MKYVKLESYEDQKTGMLSLRIVGCGNGMDGSLEGLLIAHDILEHQNGLRAIGSVGDELEAAGGIWFVRGVMYDMVRGTHNVHTPHEHVSTLMKELAYYSTTGVPLRVHVPNTKDHVCDVDFEEIITLAKDTDDPASDKFYEDALHLMRVGYNKAKRRFKDNHAYAGNQFWAISKAVDKVIKYDLSHEFQEFRLSYGNEVAECVLIEPDYY